MAKFVKVLNFKRNNVGQTHQSRGIPEYTTYALSLERSLRNSLLVFQAIIDPEKTFFKKSLHKQTKDLFLQYQKTKKVK